MIISSQFSLKVSTVKLFDAVKNYCDFEGGSDFGVWVICERRRVTT